MTDQTETFADGSVNDIRELYALQHAITDAGGTLARPVHRAIDDLRAVWDRELRREQQRRQPPPAAAPAVDRAAPAAWIDGHPQLEAIAAAVWEKCGRSDSGMCVEDDPRNIAVAALGALLAVLPSPVSRADSAEAPAAECSAQNRNYEAGPRLCIRAAQHRGDHVDERGFHWSDTVAVYPLGDGTFRTGVNRGELRRMADGAQPGTEAPWTTDGARIGRVLIWSHADIGNGDFGRGYRAAQEEARAILTRPLLAPGDGARQDGAGS
ncbi:hypothetical protein ACFV20_19400 [Streptomyces sp. NPDC059696]|uniref:hypothetical protein n=1 Tax=Streptomyces sp. NPDC059696 TaxID=3346911 RepID=UPI0036B5C7F0